MNLFESRDDLDDALDRCKETALLFPEFGSSDECVGIYPTEMQAQRICYVIGEMYGDDSQVTTEYTEMGNHVGVNLVYTLVEDQLNESLGALEAYRSAIGEETEEESALIDMQMLQDKMLKAIRELEGLEELKEEPEEEGEEGC